MLLAQIRKVRPRQLSLLLRTSPRPAPEIRTLCVSSIRTFPVYTIRTLSASATRTLSASSIRTLSVSAPVCEKSAEIVLPPELTSPATFAAPPGAEEGFSSLGLAHNYPSGWLQWFMENLHLQLEVPWWATIVATTVIVRVLLFPVVVFAQRNMTHMNNHMPEMQKKQMDLMDHTLTDQQKAEAYRSYRLFCKENNIRPFMNYVPLIAQGSVFASMFFALRGMASAPVESMKSQGALWFVDLTTCDPLYILPVVTAVSLFIHLKVGADGVDLNTAPPGFKQFLMVMPFISIPIMCQFPAALNVYWLTSNIVTMTQARIIHLPRIREKLGVPKKISWNPEDLPMTQRMYKSVGKKYQIDTKSKSESKTNPLDLAAMEKEIREKVEKELEEKYKKSK